MTFRYGHDWNIRLRQPVDEVDEAVARRRFEKGPQVCVSPMVEAGVAPRYALILGPGGSHVRVRCLDVHGSVVDVYDYSQVEGDDRLFLDNYKQYVYAEDAREAQTFSQSKAHKAWVFRQDGTATCRETVKGMEEVRISEYRDLDVSGHWRERPVFGDWDRFGLHPEPGATV